MTSELFDGRASEMRDSPWLASEDLEGLGDVELEIKAVYRHTDVEFDAGRKKPVVYSVEFAKAKRQLVLNGTNRKSIVSKFGNNIKDWIGKRVKLYVQPGIKVGGKVVNGIRIR